MGELLRGSLRSGNSDLLHELSRVESHSSVGFGERHPSVASASLERNREATTSLSCRVEIGHLQGGCEMDGDAQVAEAVRVFNAGEQARGAGLLEAVAGREGTASAAGRRALEKLALVARHGQGRPRNVGLALELLRRLPDEPTALHQQGLLLSSDPLVRDEAAARAVFERAARMGLAAAQYSLGYMHHRGRGGPADPTEAKRWYRLAAEQGDRSAHATGQGGLRRDEAAAVPYLEKAAAQGQNEAIVLLGGYYEDGRGGLERNLETAMKLYLKAAKRGSGKAKQAASDLYEHGSYRGPLMQEARAVWEERQEKMGAREKAYRRTNSSSTLSNKGKTLASQKKGARSARHSAGAIDVGQVSKPLRAQDEERRRERIASAFDAWAGGSLKESQGDDEPKKASSSFSLWPKKK